MSPTGLPDAVKDVLLVDPSLFTGPYNAALSSGLEANRIRPVWATRGLRPGEADDLGPDRRLDFFYTASDGARRATGGGVRLLKGFEHALGMRRLLTEASRFALVHFQWLVLPKLDAAFIRGLRRGRPVVLTVHDTTPFNGKAVSFAQRAGFDAALRLADRVIVHTESAARTLAERGVAADRLAVVPHGPLVAPAAATRRTTGPRWRIVLFGKLQHYKGADLLIEALGRLDPAARERLSVVIAGEPLIDPGPLLARADTLGLGPGTLEFRLYNHSAEAMAALLASADAFVFPYRVIEASGVLHLVAPLGRWLVASDLGGFAELIGRDGAAGRLVPPGDPTALAEALVDSVGRRPTRDLAAGLPDWNSIGRMTGEVYRDAEAAWRRAA